MGLDGPLTVVGPDMQPGIGEGASGVVVVVVAWGGEGASGVVVVVVARGGEAASGW